MLVKKVSSHDIETGLGADLVQQVLYEVKWRGYKDTDNTWEPEENVLP